MAATLYAVLGRIVVVSMVGGQGSVECSSGFYSSNKRDTAAVSLFRASFLIHKMLLACAQQ